MSTNQIAFTKYFENEAALAAFLTKIGDNTAASTSTGKTTTKKTSEADAADETTTKKTTTKKSGVTQSQVQAALNEVKEKFGVPEAKAIIAEVGGVKKMDEIPEDKYKEVFEACQQKLEEEESM